MADHYAQEVRDALAEMFTPAQVMAMVHRATDEDRGATTGPIPANTQRLGNVLRKVWADAYLTGVHAAMKSDGITFQKAVSPDGTLQFASTIDWDTWKPGDPEAALKVADGGLRDLLDQSNIVLRGITQTTVDRIGSIIGFGLEAGSGPKEMARLIDGYLDDPKRSQMIALTESNRAQTTAQADTLSAVGFTQFDWIAYDGACDNCLSKELANPHNMSDGMPPGHPNCRCSITGAVKQATQVKPVINLPAPALPEPTPIQAAASSPSGWAQEIRDSIEQLGEIPGFTPDLLAEEQKPTAELKAWVNAAKDIGAKISQQIENVAAKKTGLSVSDAQAAAEKAKDAWTSALREGREQRDGLQLINAYTRTVDTSLPQARYTDLAKELGIDVDNAGTKLANQMVRALYDRFPDGVQDDLKAEFKAFVELDDRIDVLGKADREARDALEKAKEAFTESVFEVLGEVRELGGVDVDFATSLRSSVVRKDVTSDPACSKLLNEIMQRTMPKDWLEKSNQAGGTVVRSLQSRGWAETNGSRSSGKIDTVINSDANERLLAHEFMHRMQYVVDGISRAEWTFLHQRMEGIKGRQAQSLKSLTGVNYGSSEVAIKDNFKDAYSGKFYAPGNAAQGWKALWPAERSPFEVMTTGFEDLVAGGKRTDYGLTSGTDLDFRSFVLGILAAL